VTDEFTKEGLAIDVDGRIRSPRVINVLSRLVSARGAPAFLSSDNGPEFVSKALLSWIIAQGIGTALIEPGKPSAKLRELALVKHPIVWEAVKKQHELSLAALDKVEPHSVPVGIALHQTGLACARARPHGCRSESRYG
jgi:hypothetical protein